MLKLYRMNVYIWLFLESLYTVFNNFNVYFIYIKEKGLAQSHLTTSKQGNDWSQLVPSVNSGFIVSRRDQWNFPCEKSTF